MKKLLIILLSACLFIYGCNYKPLNPVSTDTSSENNENTENSVNSDNENTDNSGNESTENSGGTSNSEQNNNNTQINKKTMNFKLKIEGSSSSKYFVKNDSMYASVIQINLNNKDCTYNADYNGGYYMCNMNDWGRTMNTRK